MTNFWSGWITVLVVGTIIGLFWLIFATRKGQRPAETEETLGHAFDGIEEFDNPLPHWWFLLFVGTIIFAIGYLVLYPGLGKWQGVLGWTQENQWQKEMDKAAEQYGPLYAKYAAMPIEEVAKDEAALKMGNRLFASNCAVCHGSTGRGSHGFPNLTDDQWRWGGEPETIKTSILAGRMGAMPAWGDALGEDGVKAVSAYVRDLAGLKNPEGVDVEAGQKIFATNCVACHGADGKGNPLMGAPNLTSNKGWIFGSSYTQVQQTIRYGRNGQMPKQEHLLGNDKVHLLAAYVYSLSHGEQPEKE